jgi:hypothetical protein
VIQGPGLEKLAQEFTDVMLVINRLARRYDEVFLEQLTYSEVVTTKFSKMLNVSKPGLNNCSNA